MNTRIIALVLLSVLLSTPAFPATYNIYFNNAEQGNNSTATPTVIVRDKSDEKPPEKSTEKPKENTAPSVELPAASPERQRIESTARIPVSEQVHEKHYFRFIGGVSSLNTETQTTTQRSAFEGGFETFGSSTSSEKKSTSGLHVDASYFFNRWIGLTAFVGQVYGFEGEVVPVHIGYDRVEFALMTGISNELVQAHAPLVHFGLRASGYFSSHWGLSVAARAGVTSLATNPFTYAMAEAGVTYRL